MRILGDPTRPWARVPSSLNFKKFAKVRGSCQSNSGQLYALEVAVSWWSTTQMLVAAKTWRRTNVDAGRALRLFASRRSNWPSGQSDPLNPSTFAPLDVPESPPPVSLPWVAKTTQRFTNPYLWIASLQARKPLRILFLHFRAAAAIK